MSFKKGDLVSFWLNDRYGRATGIITNLYDRDRTMFGDGVEKMATIMAFDDAHRMWPISTYKLKKLEEQT